MKLLRVRTGVAAVCGLTVLLTWRPSGRERSGGCVVVITRGGKIAVKKFAVSRSNPKSSQFKLLVVNIR